MMLENGWSCDSARQTAHARDYIELGASLAPDFGLAHSYRARWHLFRGEYEQALAAGQRGAVAAPTSGEAAMWLARAELLAGMPSRAGATAKRGLQVTPQPRLGTRSLWARPT